MFKIYFYLLYLLISFVFTILLGISIFNIPGLYGLTFIKVVLFLYILFYLLFSIGWAYNILFKKPIKKNKSVSLAMFMLYSIVALLFNGVLLYFSYETIFMKLVTCAFFVFLSCLTSYKLWCEAKN